MIASIYAALASDDQNLSIFPLLKPHQLESSVLYLFQGDEMKSC